jgi:RNA polymerase sigma-70 factor (ECF subfamily)
MTVPERELATLRSPWERSAGEVAAFEAMFRGNYADICGYIRRFVRSQAVAEELAQDVFAKIWARPGILRIDRSERGYLLVAAKRTALNYLTREGLAARYVATEEQEEAGAHRSPTEEIEERELERRVRAAVEALPRQAQAVWRLQREAGMSYAEVARELGLSVKTVERHMGRALKLLRGSLGGYLALLVVAVFRR